MDSHDDNSLSAEKGYLKETGNLAFHLALIGIIVGVAVGHLWGFKGDVILPEGQTFANTLSRYDTFQSGPAGRRRRFTPWTLTSPGSDAVFEEDTTREGHWACRATSPPTWSLAPRPGSVEDQDHQGQPTARDRQWHGLPPRQRAMPHTSPSGMRRAR